MIRKTLLCWFVTLFLIPGLCLAQTPVKEANDPAAGGKTDQIKKQQPKEQGKAAPQAEKPKKKEVTPLKPIKKKPVPPAPAKKKTPPPKKVPKKEVPPVAKKKEPKKESQLSKEPAKDDPGKPKP